MDKNKIKTICEQNGSKLVEYTSRRIALIVLPSGENLIISIGAFTAKIMRPRKFFGVFFPKVLLANNITAWEPAYQTQPAMAKEGTRLYLLAGLIMILSKCKTTKEVAMIWPTIENPIGLAAVNDL